MVGKLIKLLGDKGFGFVMADDGTEYFLHRADFLGHWNDMVDDYREGKTIYIDFKEDKTNPKGPRASSASRTDWPNQGYKED